MQSAAFLEALERPGVDKALCALGAITHRDLIQTLLAALQHPKPRLRFASARILEQVSEWSPEALYPHFDSFVRLLDQENRILQWEATRILGHLVAADGGHQFDRIFRRFFAPIRGPLMISAANVIAIAPVIAAARPTGADRIARQILRVEQAQYQTPECRNIAIGHAVRACQRLLPLLKRPKPVLAFVQRQLTNPRPATRKKAQAVLARH